MQTEALMNHVTSIGLDVHARSVTAAAFNPATGEVTTRRFGYCASDIAQWASRFESPKAAYESGVTGFDLARSLNALGLECIVCASSKLQRPSADAKRKNDANDASFLARLLATHNLVEVFIPDEETEAAHDLVRAHDDLRRDLLRARQRLNMFLMRHGLVFDEKTSSGGAKKHWTRAHWELIRKIELDHEADCDTFALYISEVRHLEAQKRQIERFIARKSKEGRWQGRVDALRCLKGVETLTAFTLVVEAQAFSRFGSAKAYASWLGLVPSERSSGERVRKGGITKCGNSLCRRLLVEAAWHYARASDERKATPAADVPLRIENHAARATKRLVKLRKGLKERGKPANVANAATARELACFVWAIGCMAEGTLD